MDDITEDYVSSKLDTADIPDPDLLIRTSGELRTSNFLPWQISYSEFYFTDTYGQTLTRIHSVRLLITIMAETGALAVLSSAFIWSKICLRPDLLVE